MGPDTEEVDASLFPSAQDAADAEKLWGEGAEEAAKANPVGKFTAEITEAEFGRSSSSDRLQIHYKLKILGGQYNDVEINKYDGMGSAQQVSITQGQLKRLGLDTSKITVKTLPANLLSLIGKKVVITTRAKDDFYNIFFNGVASTSSVSALAGGGKSPTAKGAKAGAPAGKRKF